MKTSILALGASLLASGALAGQFTANLTDHNGNDVPFTLKDFPIYDRLPRWNSSGARSKRDGPISTTDNWAGTIQEKPVAGDFHTIIADWNVPGIYPPPGAAVTSSQRYVLVEWVGIGSDCGHIFQAGTGQTLFGDGAGALQQFVWWEWFPENAIQEISGFPIAYMDKFRVNLTTIVSSPGIANGGVAIIENVTQGYAFILTLSGFFDVCLDNAEWIVENVLPASEPWPTFENVYFSECEAFTTTGAEQGITGTTAVYGASIDGRLVVSEYEDNSDFYVKP